MTDAEIIAVFGGLIGGYWLVSWILSRNDKKQPLSGSKPVGGDQPFPPATPNVPAWHEVLMVSKGASIDEIKAAYKDLIRQYHPDKVASMGPELVEIAEKKSKEINAAYQSALRGARSH